MKHQWHVIITPCFPAQYKVESKQWPGTNNSWTEYFGDKEAAQQEADRCNAAQTI